MDPARKRDKPTSDGRRDRKEVSLPRLPRGEADENRKNVRDGEKKKKHGEKRRYDEEQENGYDSDCVVVKEVPPNPNAPKKWKELPAILKEEFEEHADEGESEKKAREGAIKKLNDMCQDLMVKAEKRVLTEPTHVAVRINEVNDPVPRPKKLRTDVGEQQPPISKPANSAAGAVLGSKKRDNIDLGAKRREPSLISDRAPPSIHEDAARAATVNEPNFPATNDVEDSLREQPLISPAPIDLLRFVMAGAEPHLVAAATEAASLPKPAAVGVNDIMRSVMTGAEPHLVAAATEAASLPTPPAVGVAQQPAAAAEVHNFQAEDPAVLASKKDRLIQDMAHAWIRYVETVPTSSRLLTDANLAEMLQADAAAANAAPAAPVAPAAPAAPLLEHDTDAVDRKYWNCHATSSPQCPRGCPLDTRRKDSLANRKLHYQRCHYQIYYDLVQSTRSPMDKWILKNFGVDNADIRSCLLCPKDTHYKPEFKGRIALARHQSTLHNKEFLKKCAAYKKESVTGGKAETLLHVILTPQHS